MNHATTKQGKKKGFTLIELSIVLVIIGLIVGGVLVGQDLIKAAELRATISQVEKYNTAVNTFRLKYNGIPGDLSNGGTFFSGVTGTVGGANQGDGDGLVEGVSGVTSGAGAACVHCLAGENVIFWYMLSDAGVISDTITAVAMDATDTDPDEGLPKSKAGSGHISMHASGGRNYYVITNFGSADMSSGDVGTEAALTPADSFQIDSKVDDGIATTGGMIAVANDNFVPQTASSADDCHGGTAYAVGSASADTKSCTLSYRAQF